jgi:hypothetical protein
MKNGNFHQEIENDLYMIFKQLSNVKAMTEHLMVTSPPQSLKIFI